MGAGKVIGRLLLTAVAIVVVICGAGFIAAGISDELDRRVEQAEQRGREEARQGC